MTDELADVCVRLQALQRERAVIIKSRNMQANRLQAIVAGTLGYSSGLKEAERKKLFGQASKLIKEVMDGTAEPVFAQVIRTTMAGIDAFNAHKKEVEKAQLKAVKALPVVDWVEQPEQRGFGLPMLAVVIGETGDLRNYANPSKVWRRLGCAPWTFEGTTQMGASWRSGKSGKLPAAEWEAFGYSPRRRSIAYLIGEGLIKQNTVGTGPGDDDSAIESDRSHVVAGPYKRRYLAARETFAARHPEYKPLRCHLHGMLCATKHLLENLWRAWHGKPNRVRGEAGVVAAAD